MARRVEAGGHRRVGALPGAMIPSEPEQPSRDCPLCPRLVALRLANRATYPDWHNAPVPSWGPRDARIMVLGMAPRGSAARTARAGLSPATMRASCSTPRC
jgi:hypothetical protein